MKKLFTLLALCAFGSVLCSAQSRVFTSDNGDGTFNNPVIYSDFPDIDICRVGDTYYMLSTTMFYFPGGTIMQSKDLVNWEYAANPIKYIEYDDDCSLLNGKNRYSRGMWASAFQYNPHDGWYYLLFNTLHDGSYLLKTKDIAGTKWSRKKLNHSFYDCGLLFDDDGQIYVSRGNGQIWIDLVDDNFKVQKSWKVCDSPEGHTYEGSRPYHIGEYYYVYAVDCAWPGKQICFRSKTLEGPWEFKLLLDYQVIHQGGLVQTQTGEWWTMLFRDMWPWGRIPYLIPVKWEDGWPVIGENGKVATKYNKPNVGEIAPEAANVSPVTNDGFRDTKLDKQWEWNHNPDDKKWSLTERPGFLRLKTATKTDDIWKARNTLTQRMFGYWQDLAHSYGTFRVDLTNMKDGDCCGITTIQDPHAYLLVTMEDGKKTICQKQTSFTGKSVGNGSKPVALDCDIVLLRGVASFNSPGTIQYYRSEDEGKTWKTVGSAFTMQYDLSVFVGNRWGIFNYATKSLGGYIDVDWFSTDPEFDEDEFYGTNAIQQVQTGNRCTSKEIYNMQGVKMSSDNLTPGVYIKNGKKVVIK